MCGFSRGKYAGILADYFSLGVSCDLLKCRVYIFDMSFRVGNEHNIDALINSCEKSFDFFFCLFALSGVLFKRLNFFFEFCSYHCQVNLVEFLFIRNHPFFNRHFGTFFPFHDGFKFLPELFEEFRFYNKGFCPQGERKFPVLAARINCRVEYTGNGTQVWIHFDIPEEGKAIDVRHQGIGDDHVGFMSFSLFKAILSIHRLDNFMVVFFDK